MAVGMAQVFHAHARQNAYANNILFQVAAKLTVAALEAAQSPSRESAYALLVHLLTAEAFYMTQVGGNTQLINKAAVTTIDQLVSLATVHNERFVAFVAALHDGDLVREVTVEFSDKTQVRYQVWQVLMQVFLHSAQHRGELSILLSALGQPLPIDEIIVRFAEENGQPWPYKGK